MRKLRNWSAVLLSVLLAAALTVPAAAVPARTAPIMLIPQDAGIHAKYMDGSDGWFRPEQDVTRAELAQMLSRVTADIPASTPVFYDVPWDAWYAPSVQKAAGLDLMSGTDGAFRPNDSATRAECAAALAQLLPYDAWSGMQTFPDVPTGHWAYLSIARTASYGLFRGDGAGLFRPDDGLKRCEAAAVFNRLLGRSGDLAYILNRGGLRTFPDVPPSHWAYSDIMEATVTHQCTSGGYAREQWTSAVNEPTLAVDPQPTPTPDPTPSPSPEPTPTPEPLVPSSSDGPRRVDGRLYWFINGEPIRSQSVSGLYFDENGCYTTGNAELDEKLNAIVEELTDDSMTRDQKLRVLFNYVRDNFKYLKRPLISKGQTGWEPEYALFFLNNGKGNCYSFSAAYCLLCRELGLPAYTVVGSVLNSPHGWVEIVLDGSVYMFDTQLEWRYLHDWGKSGYDFFKMSPDSTPVQYTRS